MTTETRAGVQLATAPVAPRRDAARRQLAALRTDEERTLARPGGSLGDAVADLTDAAKVALANGARDVSVEVDTRGNGVFVRFKATR